MPLLSDPQRYGELRVACKCATLTANRCHRRLSSVLLQQREI